MCWGGRVSAIQLVQDSTFDVQSTLCNFYLALLYCSKYVIGMEGAWAAVQHREIKSCGNQAITALMRDVVVCVVLQLNCLLFGEAYQGVGQLGKECGSRLRECSQYCENNKESQGTPWTVKMFPLSRYGDWSVLCEKVEYRFSRVDRALLVDNSDQCDSGLRIVDPEHTSHGEGNSRLKPAIIAQKYRRNQSSYVLRKCFKKMFEE